MSLVPAEVMEAAWVEVASFPDSRGRTETQRLQRERPELLRTSWELLKICHLPFTPWVSTCSWSLFALSSARAEDPERKSGCDRAAARAASRGLGCHLVS